VNVSAPHYGENTWPDHFEYNNPGSVFGFARDLAVKTGKYIYCGKFSIHYMKLLMGFIVLLVALVAVTGCTQTASPSVQTTTATTAPATTAVTTVTTAVPTTIATTVPVNTTAEETLSWEATPTPASMVTIIHLTSAGFTPETDIVLPGTSVFFANNDNVTHTIVGIGNSTGTFNSGEIIPGSAFPYTFGIKSGILYYGLADNASVMGTIIVQPPSGTTTYHSA
jgi:plastocyanin